MEYENAIEEFKTYFMKLVSTGLVGDISFSFCYDKDAIMFNMDFEATSADLFYKYFGDGYKKRLSSKVILTTSFICEAGLDIFVSEGDVIPDQEKQTRIVSSQPAASDIKNLILKHSTVIRNAHINNPALERDVYKI